MGNNTNLKTVFILEKNEDGSDRLANGAAAFAVGKSHGIKISYTRNEKDELGYKLQIPEEIEFEEQKFLEEVSNYVDQSMREGREGKV